MKIVACFGEKTQEILHKLTAQGDINFDLIGVNDAEELLKQVKSLGIVDKILIMEKGYSPNVDLRTLSSDVECVLALSKEADLKANYIKYIKNKNIHIINLGVFNQISYTLIKRLLTEVEINENYLYKPEQIQGQVAETTETNTETEEVHRERQIESESPTETPLRNTMPNLELHREVEPEKEVIQPQTQVKTIIIKENNQKDLKTILKNYKNGCVILRFGTTYSYTTTNTLFMAETCAKIGLKTLVIDLDTENYPLSYLNKDLYENHKLYINSAEDTNNPLFKALVTNNIQQTAYLYKTNLYILSGHIFADSVDFKDTTNTDYLTNLLRKYRQMFDIIFLDVSRMNFEIISSSIAIDNYIFNIRYSNKGFIQFIRYLESMAKKNEIIKNLSIIAVNKTNRTLLETNSKEIDSIDKFLEDKGIFTEIPYYNIPVIGEITDVKGADYMFKKWPIDNNFYEKLLINSFARS